MALRVGTSGWSYDDWEGKVYRMVAPRERLTWYAGMLPTVEVDSTYYRDPEPSVVDGWIHKTAESAGFELSVKAPKRLTHEAIVDGAPEACARIATEWAELVALPLARGKRLGAILLQLSPGVLHTRDHMARLDATLGALKGYEVAVELRNKSWHEGGRIKGDAVELFDAHAAAIALVDGPGFPDITAGSAEHAYVRFHGRNVGAWHKPSRYPGERYDYLYSEEELRPWAERLATLAREKRDVRVYFNNHVEGKGFRNAHQMEDLLEAVGAPLVRATSAQRRLPV